MKEEKQSPRLNYKSPGSKRRAGSDLNDRKYKRRNTIDGRETSSDDNIDTIYRLLCPNKKIGSVLGKGGDTINALRKETHAKIHVADAISGADERMIIIYSYIQEDDVKNTTKGDLKLHCAAQDALLKIHERIVSDDAKRENSESRNGVFVQILVPHNQVGCLLGKGGDIIKKLRKDTRADILISTSKQLPLCALSYDELVEISGEPITVKRALYEISTLLHQHPRKVNPPLEEIISHGNSAVSRRTPPRPWFDEYRSEAPGHAPSHFNRNEVLEYFSIKILCAAEKIGGIIGKNGANVTRLERETGASIRVEGTGPDEERVIIVRSKEAHSDPISPTIEAVLKLHRRVSDPSKDGDITTRLLVASSLVGCLLGRGGDIISEMRRRTRTDIQVFSKSEKPNIASHDEELVQISGDERATEIALAEIVSRLRVRSFREESSHVEFGNTRQPSPRIGATDRPLYERPMAYDYDYPKSPDYFTKPRNLPIRHEYVEGYDYPKSYDYDYPKSYEYSKGYDYTESYDYPKDAGQQLSSHGYRAPMHHIGYSDLRNPIELRSPTRAAPGYGGSNFSDARQVPFSSSWRYKDDRPSP